MIMLFAIMANLCLSNLILCIYCVTAGQLLGGTAGGNHHPSSAPDLPSFNEYLLSIYQMPGTVLASGDVAGSWISESGKGPD